MALMFPWATKEYLLWEMSLAQIIMYHNLGIEIQYPSTDKPTPGGLQNMSADKAREAREAARRVMAENKISADVAESEVRKEPYRSKYGDI